MGGTINDSIFCTDAFVSFLGSFNRRMDQQRPIFTLNYGNALKFTEN